PPALLFTARRLCQKGQFSRRARGPSRNEIAANCCITITSKGQRNTWTPVSLVRAKLTRSLARAKLTPVVAGCPVPAPPIRCRLPPPGGPATTELRHLGCRATGAQTIA